MIKVRPYQHISLFYYRYNSSSILIYAIINQYLLPNIYDLYEDMFSLISDLTAANQACRYYTLCYDTSFLSFPSAMKTFKGYQESGLYSGAVE